jgi:hypothetical protein
MFKEICAVINKLKSDKAAISDNMPRELIKKCRKNSEAVTIKLILKIWDKEQLPTQ